MTRVGRVVLSAALIVVFAWAAGCGGSDDNSGGGGGGGGDAATGGEPVKFALVAAGIPGVDLYKNQKIGAEAAAKAINDDGGFGGRKVEIVDCNSQFNPSVAATCATKARSQDVVAMLGCDPAWTAGGLPIFAKAEIPSFNCPTTGKDLTDPWAFGLNGATRGAFGGMAQYLCSLDDVKNVVVLGQSEPQGMTDAKEGTSGLKGCGKTVTYVFAPLNPPDWTQYVQKALAAKPDFLAMYASAGPSVQLYKALNQAGWSAAKTINGSPAANYVATMQPAGAAMDGAYIANIWASWGKTDDPDVTAYVDAVKAVSPEDPRNSNIEYAYSTMMYFYTAAKKIGFDKFDAKALADFSQHENDVPWPLSYKLTNPGPQPAPQVKQPYVQIQQWKDGTLSVVKTGDGGDGWVNGW